MALSTFVLVNRVSNLSDARFCAGMGADVLGFMVEPGQPDSITKEAFSEITGWVAGVSFLGEFTSTDPTEINRIAGDFGLDYVLLNQLMPLQEMQQLEQPVVLRIDLEHLQKEELLVQELSGLQAEVAYFLVSSDDQKELGENSKQIIIQAAEQLPILLGCGITPANVPELLKEIQPAGICLQGGQEIKPGLRDFNELADILEQLEQEDA